jgi:hypothetical protein
MQLPRAFPLLDLLIAQNEIPQAWQVWQQALVATGTPAALHDGSRVTDGGFESEFTDGGFGWRYTAQPGADVTVDSSDPHSGSRDVKLTFDGSTNVDFENFYQYVPVEPDTQYHFSAYLRAENLITDTGVRFELSDPADQYAPTFVTDGVVGTEPWTPVALDFRTGPQTHVLLLRLRRPVSAVLTKIEGTAWADDVSLVPAAAPGETAP